MNLTAALELFLFGFLLNMVWEVWHSQLYTTCLNQSWRKNVPLLTQMSVKDAFFIVVFYIIAFALAEYNFGNSSLYGTVSHAPHVFFFLIAVTFAFVDEKISVKKGRWEYAPAMPLIFGVGVTPLLEIAITGLLAYFMTSL